MMATSGTEVSLQPQQQQHVAPSASLNQQRQQQEQNQQHPVSPSTRLVSPTTKSRTSTVIDQNVLIPRLADEETADGRIRNREAMHRIRETWIYKQVRARQDEFTQYRKALVFVGTWNVNAKGKDEPLDDWICADWGRIGQQPDLVAVGFQEIVDLNAVNVAVDNKTQQKSSFWVERLQTTLNNNNRIQGDDYVLLQQKSMVGLLICLFVRRSHIRRVTFVQAQSVGVGVLGMGGNKGGVSVRIQFYDSTICFICSHLAAHRENVTGRNNDFANVLQKTSFDIGEDSVKQMIRNGSHIHQMGTTTTDGLASNNPSGGTTSGPSGSSIGIVSAVDHDILVWLGDLNYRIDESMQTEKVLQLAERNVIGELLHLDQLNIERKAGRVFQGFEEGPIQFPPTYKYQPGTDVYDTRPDKKIRAPAWCDRILWRTADDASQVHLFSYNRSERPNCSDHKAVYSSMQITVKDVIPQKREAVYEELMKLLDRHENQSAPKITLDKIAINFGSVRFEESVTVPIQITNAGSVLAQYRFVPKPDEVGICKPWLQVSPMFGMIIPGDQPLNVNITITVDKDTARSLNSGRELLEDILILRLENGRDYYITIHAEYARSCFGMSLDELILYPDAIRTIPVDPIERAKKVESIQVAGGTALCVPKELWRILDALYEKGLSTPHLFVESGVPEEIQQIRESLDTGGQFQQQFSIHSYAEVLTTFLSHLATPVIPPQLAPAMEIDEQNIQMSARRILEELPPIHYNVFVYMISFFREVLSANDRNLLTSTKVGRIATSCLLSIGGSDNDSSNAAVQKRTAVTLILVHLLETNSI